jgi:23S rRNA pseudouridine1911/1915/1917 synthase
LNWLPAAWNAGHTYRDRVGPEAAGLSVCTFYTARYRHSALAVWRQRLAAGQICRNGRQLRADGPLAAGDRLAWHRPPWQEGAVPVLPSPLFDDGDLLVFDKPSGLPVLPGGGWLEHTVLGELERQVAAGALDAAAGRPRPVHRLGRFTSGLLLCARGPARRAWLSTLLRESTQEEASRSGRPPCGGGACRKTYRALLQPPAPGSPLLALQPGEGLAITTAIGRCPHARLGSVWAAAQAGDPTALPARSELQVLQRQALGWLAEVAIATGRPHQIRIHTAAAGAPLQGDPLYRSGGLASDRALPGEGGYHLHAHRLRLCAPDGSRLDLEAPLPERLRMGSGG